MKALAHQDPSHVRPPLAVERRVWVAVFVRKLVMNAMSCNPENRPAFESESPANGQEIFHPLRSLVSAMSEQPVIAHANAEASRYPPEKKRDKQCFPGEEKQGDDGADVKCRHENCCDPINLIIVASAFEGCDLQGWSPGLFLHFYRLT